MKRHNSREATPQQISQLYDLAAETKSGSFGMPTGMVDPSKGFQVHKYHLVEVRDLPYGYQGEEAISNPDYDLSDSSFLDNSPAGYRSRLFWPSLEVAMGLRQAGHDTSTSIQELLAINRQWSAPLYREREINEYGYPLSEEEVPRIEGHQTFDSVYAASIGKHVLDLSVGHIVDTRKEELSESYAIGYEMSKLPPQNNIDRPAYNLKDPKFEAEVRLYSPGKPVYIDTSRYISHLGPFGLKSLKRTMKTLRRSEADYIAADLEKIKDIYRQWS